MILNAIVQFQNIMVEEVAKLIEANKVTVKKDLSRPLPALKTYSHSLYHENRYLADIADSSVRTYLQNPTLEGDLIVYQKSIKIMRTEKASVSS